MTKSIFTALLLASPLIACAIAAAETENPVYKGHGFAMHGTPKYGPTFTHFDYVNPKAPKGGSVNLGAGGGFDTFNEFTLKGTAAEGLGLCYDTLMAGAADEPFSSYGLVAESVEVPEDRSWVIFHLRPEAKWHDGTPITADDVVWTFNTLITQGTPGYRFYYSSIENVEKLDLRTVKFSFTKGKINRELPLICGQLTILPRHYWMDKDFSATTLTPPLGSGPYRIKSFEPGRSITYERVKDYWGADVPARVGTFNFDDITFDYYRDEVVLLEVFKAGGFDYRLENMSKRWATEYTIPAVEQGLMHMEKLPHQRAAGMQSFAFNTRKRIFQDSRVREACAYAFDFEWTNKKLLYSAYTRSRSFFGNCELEATGVPEGEELELLQQLAREFPGKVPPELFEKAYMPPGTGEWSNDREHRLATRKNIQKATELLKAAGWQRDKEKRLVNEAIPDKDGTPTALAFEILLVSPTFERIVLPFAETLKTLGMDVTVRTVDTAQYQNRLETFDFDVVVGSWGQSLSPGNEQRGYWGSAAADTEGSRNLIGIANPAIDKAIDLVIAAPDRESLVTRTRALDRLLQWGQYVIPHWFIGYDRVLHWDKFERPATIPDNGVNFWTWWINEKKASTLAARRKALK